MAVPAIRPSGVQPAVASVVSGGAPRRCGGWSSAQLDHQCDVAYNLGAAGHSWPRTRSRLHPGPLAGWALDDLQEAWETGRHARQTVARAA